MDKSSSPDEKVFIMCFAPITLVFVVLIACCFTFFLIRRRLAPVDVAATSPTSSPNDTALDPEAFQSLPIFVCSSKSSDDKTECAVCLMEFRDSEKGRVLPRCAHRFHAECIDTWFHSHSTCPLCRSPVKLEEDPDLPS